METFNVNKSIVYTGECPYCNTWYDRKRKPDTKKFTCPNCGKKSRIIFNKGEN